MDEKKFSSSVDMLFSCGLERCQVEMVLHRFLEKLCLMEDSGEICLNKASEALLEEVRGVADRK